MPPCLHAPSMITFEDPGSAEELEPRAAEATGQHHAAILREAGFQCHSMQSKVSLSLGISLTDWTWPADTMTDSRTSLIWPAFYRSDAFHNSSHLQSTAMGIEPPRQAQCNRGHIRMSPHNHLQVWSKLVQTPHVPDFAAHTHNESILWVGLVLRCS